MGADSFYSVGKGSEPTTAFNATHDEARYEHGSGGYSGTIAEKHDYIVHQRNAIPYDEAMELANALLDDYEGGRYSDKWGPAGAIPLCTLNRSETVREFTLDVLVDPKRGDVWSETMKAARVEAAKQVLPTECITGVSITGGTPAVRTTVHQRDGGVLRYVAMGTPRCKFENGFDTVDEAVAYAEKYDPPNYQRDRSATYEIIGLTDAVVLVDRQVELINQHVKVTVGARPAEATTVGWLFFGFASC